MEKFIVRGYSSKDKDAPKCILDIPPAKNFNVVAVKNSEQVLQSSLLLSRAVSRSKYESSHAKPFAMIDGKSTYLPGSLRHLLNGHPYPVSQGPVMIPLDTNTDPKRLPHIVIGYKTVFTHNHTQKCVRWVPEVTGVAAWTEDEDSYSVSDLEFRIQGAASTMDMGVIYTCHMSGWSGCVIYCSCSVCTKTRSHCQKLHRKEPCSECNTQCTTHQIMLSRIFDTETDQYSIITERITKYRFAHVYAGIPKSCESCSQDLLEHQVLHLVFHMRCRFCRFEMRPLIEGNVISLDDYKEMDEVLKERDAKTCSVCLRISDDKLAREKHESVVHMKETQKFKCDQCEKTYSNKNALNYHIAKHKDVLKPSCELCGSQFSCTRSLERHKLTIHQDSSEQKPFECEDCGKGFSMESALKRHQREQHFGSKLNLDFHEGFATPAIFKCEQCEINFKRNSDLKRHTQSAHSVKNFICSHCNKAYSRKDVLDRHIVAKHI
jgi:hypothetical protein